MARIGPNQDINDPETIINLAYLYQQMSDAKGDFLAQSNAQNPNAEGSPIVNVSIPFKILDGSTELLFGSDILVDDGEFVYDTDLVSTATIVTYVDLAERFRDYWSTLNNVLGQLADFDFLQEEDIDPEGPFTVTIPTSQLYTRGTQGGTSHDHTSYSHSPTEPVETPEWDGVGPTDYNQLTYPQLLSALADVGTTRSEITTSWDTIYHYLTLVDSFGNRRAVEAFFGNDGTFVFHTQEQQYVQFHNLGPSILTITLTADAAGTFQEDSSGGEVTVGSWAEINDINVFPDPFLGQVVLLPSFLSSQAETGPGSDPEDFPKSVSVSHSRSVQIPPGKSAFIGCMAKSETKSAPNSAENTGSAMTAIVTLDGKIVTTSATL